MEDAFASLIKSQESGDLLSLHTLAQTCAHRDLIEILGVDNEENGDVSSDFNENTVCCARHAGCGVSDELKCDLR